MKVVKNVCYGGFSLSDLALERLAELIEDFNDIDIDDQDFRADPALVQVVEELGDAANGNFARLEIVDVDVDIGDWYIDEYDGYETIHEYHRTW